MLGGLIGHTILCQKEERNEQEVGVGCKAQEPPSSNPHPKDAPLSNHTLLNSITRWGQRVQWKSD